mmetsp:Transcript_1929/g.4339  ORF Transcript_1929/g.4339 Transcript_1929/m.4339 type:complete len:574 (-) Transcript_1929:113-1834(-)
MASDTLLARIGGEMGVDAFVDLFYNLMVEDSNLGKFFARFNLQILKDRTVAYLVGEWGGSAYVGIPLFEAHAQLHITKNQFDIMMVCIKKALKQLKKDKRVTDDIIKSIELMRDPITDPGGKFKDWYIKKLQDAQKENEAQEDLVQTPMGFSIPRAKLEEQREKERKQKQLNEKLAAKRVERERILKEGGTPSPPTTSPRRNLQVAPQAPAPAQAPVVDGPVVPKEKKRPAKASSKDAEESTPQVEPQEEKKDAKRSSDKSKTAPVKSKASNASDASEPKVTERNSDEKKREKKAADATDASEPKVAEKKSDEKKREKKVKAKSNTGTEVAEPTAPKKTSKPASGEGKTPPAVTGDAKAKPAKPAEAKAFSLEASAEALQSALEAKIAKDEAEKPTLPVQNTDGVRSPPSKAWSRKNSTTSNSPNRITRSNTKVSIETAPTAKRRVTSSASSRGSSLDSPRQAGGRTPPNIDVAALPQAEPADVRSVPLARKGSNASSAISATHQDTDVPEEPKMLKGFHWFSSELSANTDEERAVPPPPLSTSKAAPSRFCFICKWHEDEEDAAEDSTWRVE